MDEAGHASTDCTVLPPSDALKEYQMFKYSFLVYPAVALLSLAAGVSTARAYHLYTAVFYVLGILAVWWLVRVGSGSRRQAWLAGLATALVSPSVFVLKAIREDNLFWFPQRLWVLAHYGEGPHISALSILPAALSALVVSTNFYGALALAVFFPILAWSVFLAQRDAGVWPRALESRCWHGDCARSG